MSLAIELFACSGGMAEGFRRAGVTFDLVFDANPDACASYEANIGHRPVCMDVRDLLRMARAGAFLPPVRLLVADPPCTPWSLAGDRRGLDDERDMLRETCELISLLRPEVYLIGNVPGLETEPNIAVVQQTIGALAGAGYCVRDFICLDAADYGVPQHRVRPFWFGHLRGPCIRWPAPTHHDPARGDPLFGDTRPWVTCREALGHLSGKDLGRPIRLAWKPAKHHRPSDPDGCARTLTTNPNTDGALLRVSHGHPISQPDQPAWTITTHSGRGSSTLAWPWDRPSTTVTTDACGRIGVPEHHGKSSLSKTSNAVVLSERAALILQGFPETWRLLARTKRGRWSMLGQAMPPPLAEAVARSVAEQLARTQQEAA